MKRPDKRTETSRNGYGKRQMKYLILMGMLLSGCGVTANSGTESTRALCDVLRERLPTYSEADTEETLEAGADFLDVFEGVC